MVQIIFDENQLKTANSLYSNFSPFAL